MLTNLGKTLRIIRMDRGLLLKDMADMLDIKPSYLSSIENGKRKPSKNFISDLESILSLTENEKISLENGINELREEVNIDISGFSTSQKNLSLAFARKINDLSQEDKRKIMDILNKRGSE